MYPAVDPVAGVDKAFLYIIGFSIIFLIFVTGLMIYFVIRYRAARHPQPQDIRGNTKLEIAWMIIPTFIALFMFYLGWESYLGLRNVPPDAIQIGVVAEMFSWNFTYPNGKTSQDLLMVPQGKPVKLNITSKDVIHSFFLPAFRIKVDAVKGMQTYTWFRADKLGQYKIFCTEYCGIGHSEMIADLQIVAPQAYENWLAQKPASIESTPVEYTAADQTAPQFDLSQFHQLKGPVNFFWKIDAGRLHVRLSAVTTGWVGIGFNPVRKMKGADFILGMVDQGRVMVTDDFGTGSFNHKHDASLGGKNDFTNVFGREENGITEIGFSIPLDSGDATDTVLTAKGDTVILLAHGSGPDNFQGVHSYRGKYKVNLATGTYEKLQ